MRLCKFVSIAVIFPAFTIALTLGQQPQQQPVDEVVRITTDLVQTGVVVMDKQGQFVDGLSLDQFVLKVDGQIVAPAFVERVVAGTVREREIEKSMGQTGATSKALDSGTSYRGRSIIFFIDDLHLSPDSVQRTRKGIL